jgi:D-arginine dehydrogenase
MITFDYIVIGAGIAGASVAAELSRNGRVCVIERESQPGYHSTGRSATLFSEIYGNSIIRGLSRASRQFLFEPPAGFSENALVRPRGVLYYASAEQSAEFAAFLDEPDVARDTVLLSPAAAHDLIPIIKPELLVNAAHEPMATDIDASSLLAGHIRALRSRGARLVSDSTIAAIEYSQGQWRVSTQTDVFAAPVLIDAAGAWADEVAQLAGVAPVGLQPMRRTALLIDAPPGTSIAAWPMAFDIGETVYFKPDAGKLLLSPADETPTPPCDAQPDDYDVAVAVDRFEQATGLSVPRVQHRWAGLRTFARDRTPVVGFDPQAPGFFWLAGQGGYGIQTSPAMSRLAAALASGHEIPDDIRAEGVTAESVSPRRLRTPA